MAAVAILVALILFTSRSTGGPFARRVLFHSYFANAAGLKTGAPVTLEGVTIGNVLRVRVVPERNPTPVEVTMRVSSDYLYALHTDSTTAIAQSGVLGDSYVDIDSTRATGPRPEPNSELRATQSPTIQSVISSSQESLGQISVLIQKLQTLADTLNSKNGTVGALINDPAYFAKVSRITDNLERITAALGTNQGTLGKLIHDDTLYNNANSAIARLNGITQSIDEGRGSAGKLLRDESLYNNLNGTADNANRLLSDINAGRGGLGKVAKDPAFAAKLDDAVTRLDSILQGIDEGKGTIGQLMQNRSLFDHADETMDQAQQLIKAIRENPKKYFVIRFRLF